MAGEVITVRGLKSAIALLTAMDSEVELSQEDVLGDTPPEEALRALTGLAVAFLRQPLGAPGEVLRTVGGLTARFEAEGTVE